MHNGVRFSHRAVTPVKRAPLRPVELTDDEMTRLLRVFLEGKTEVLEDEVLTLVTWAQTMRFGAFVLQMVLAGELTPVVENGEVHVALRASRGKAS
jgi:hypothetical protein